MVQNKLIFNINLYQQNSTSFTVFRSPPHYPTTACLSGTETSLSLLRLRTLHEPHCLLYEHLLFLHCVPFRQPLQQTHTSTENGSACHLSCISCTYDIKKEVIYIYGRYKPNVAMLITVQVFTLEKQKLFSLVFYLNIEHFKKCFK